MKNKTNRKLPFVSIIIPTFNRDLPLRQILKSLFKQTYARFEIIVVDQSEKIFPEKELFLGKNKGKIIYLKNIKTNAAAARNYGIKQAKGEIVLFVDDDILAQKNLILNHALNFKNNSIGAVGGRVITEGQIVEAKTTNTGQITKLGYFTDGFASLVKQEITTVISCNASFRRSILLKLGGFDENFSGPIREDSDLSLRTRALGYKIIFEPKAVVTHVRAESGGYRKTEGRLQWYFGFFKNETYFFLKHRPKYLLPLILLTRINWVFRCMFGFGREVSLRSITTPIKGIIAGIKTYWEYKKIIDYKRRA